MTIAIVPALRDYLLTIPAVTDVVDSRIYTLEFPQSLVAPAVRLAEIDRVSPMQLRGNVALRRVRVQVDAVARDGAGDPYQTAHDLAGAVRGDLTGGQASGLVGFRGALSGIPIAGIMGADQREIFDPTTRLVRVEQDFFVWFQQV
jgi:Protein of unknown function (DUF3168)